VSRRARLAVAIWLAALLGSGYWIARYVTVTTDLGAFLPPAATRAQEALVDQLRAGVASRLLLVGIDGADEAALAGASRELAQRLDASGAFGTVANGEPERLARERDRLFALRYALSPGVRPERFSTEGLRTALQEELELLASPLGLLTRRTLPADPTGELRRLAAPLAGAAGPMLREGVWMSADGKRALLGAETRAPGFDLDAQERAAGLVRSLFAEIAPPGAVLRLAGPGLAGAAARAAIERDARRATLASLLGVVLLLGTAYRSVLPVLLSGLPALTGMAIGVTAVSLWFGQVHGITLGFAAILIGEAVDYPTYLYAHAVRGEPLAQTASRIGPTLRLAVLTTACGAIAMLLSSFRGLAQLGLLTMVGIAVAGLVTWFVLPSLTPARALDGKLMHLPFEGRSLVPGRRLWLGALLVAAAVLVITANSGRLWDDDLANLSPLPEPAKALDSELRAQLGAPDLRHLLAVTAPDREAALQKSEALQPLLERAVAEGWIGGYDLAARTLPSRRTQETRRAALPDGATLAARLAQAQRPMPFRDGLFAPFLADVERARGAPPVEADAWRGTALASRLDALLAPGAKGWVAFVPLSPLRDAEALRAALHVHGDDGVLHIDLKREADALVAGYRAESLRLVLFGLLCIAALLYAGLRNLGLTLRVLAPALGAALLCAATLLAAGARLSVVHLVALLLVVGVGLNYALFFNRRPASEGERALTRLSLVVAGLASLCAALSLATGSTPVLRAIGSTIALGTVYAFLLAALLARRSPPGAV
jgi:predicted exporter